MATAQHAITSPRGRAERRHGSAMFAVRSDLLAFEAGVAVKAAAHPYKRTADRLGRSVDVVEKYGRGEPSSPVFRHDELLMAVENPWILLAHARVVTMRAGLNSKSTDELVARWHEIMEIESDYQCREDKATQTYYATRDLRGLARAHEAEAALQDEFAAICVELDERAVDPMEAV